MSTEVKCATIVRYVGLDEIEDLVSAFESTRLPRERWNHHAHLTIAFSYLIRYENKKATTLIRRNIKRCNNAHGIVTTKDSGYHETITLFFIRVVSSYLRDAGAGDSIVDLLNGLIARYGDKSLPFAYYTKERLMSWEERTRWIAPDLRRLD